MAEPRFFYSVDGSEQNGPVSIDDLRQLFAVGTLSGASYLCQEGETSWERLNPEFFTTPAEAAEPEATEPETPPAEIIETPAEPEITEPQAAEPATFEPAAAEPATIEPEPAAAPEVLDPEVHEPEATEAAPPEEAGTEVLPAEAAAGASEDAAPEILEPQTVEPPPSGPEIAEPVSTLPEPIPVQSSFLDTLESAPAEPPPSPAPPAPSWRRSLSPPPAKRKPAEATPPAATPPAVPASSTRKFEPPPSRRKVAEPNPPSVPAAAPRAFEPPPSRRAQAKPIPAPVESAPPRPAAPLPTERSQPDSAVPSSPRPLDPPPPKRKSGESKIGTFPVSTVRSIVPPSVEPEPIVAEPEPAPAVYSPPRALTPATVEMPEEESEPPPEPARRGHWIFDAITCLVGLGLSGWLVYGQYTNGDHRTPSFLLVFFTTLLVAVLLFPWLVARFLAPRRWRSPVFAVLAFAVAGLAAVWSLRPHPIPAAAAPVVQASPAAQPPTVKEDPNDPRIARDLQAVSQQLADEIKASNDAEKASKFEGASFNGPADITARQTAIARLFQAQQDVVAFLQNIGDRCHDALAHDGFSDALIADAADHFRQSNHVELLIPFWQAQAKLSSDRMARLDFLAKNPTSWSVKDGKLTFVDSASVATYNVYASALAADAKSIEDAQKSMAQ